MLFILFTFYQHFVIKTCGYFCLQFLAQEIDLHLVSMYSFSIGQFHFHYAKKCIRVFLAGAISTSTILSNKLYFQTF